MKNKLLLTLIIVILFFISSCSQNVENEKPILALWYKQPANEWMKSLPIGNGRFGAMIFGSVENDRIALNEITMWAGEPDPNQEIPCGKAKLAEMRKLFFEGKIEEGNNLALKYLCGKPNTFGTHVPVGDLKINFDCNITNVSDYRRELNLEDAIAIVSYKSDDVNYKREYFCSNPDNVIVIKLSADKKKSITCNLALDLLNQTVITTSKEQIEFAGKVAATLKVKGFPNFNKGGVNFIGKINVSTVGGSITSESGQVKINQADDVVLTIDIRSNYNNPNYKAICENTIKQASTKEYAQIKEAHIKDYSNLFGRVALNFGKTNVENLPTDVRLSKYKAGKNDPNMSALFFQYGRYLLISSSRENSPLPSNLQGLWNDNLAANMPWTCDYHLDINTQQNYWPANITNLAECNAPLFNYIDYLSKFGEKTAKKVYGSPGWVAHTMTNVWGYTSPGELPVWGLFPTASAWIASHLWKHYLFTNDHEFLRNKAYPLLKKNADFFIDYMVENPTNGYLITGPSTSPENVFSYKGKPYSLSMMPTCDRVFIYELFSSCIASSRLLNIDKEFCNKLENAIKKFPPLKISKDGTVQEWFDDYDIAQPNHRHTTHLTALYPYSQISLEKTPELAQAAKKTIEAKLSSQGWEDVEWSRANMINFYARLKEPDSAYSSIFSLLKKLTRENLLTISVSGIAGASNDIFVLDGNEAATAGIAEMLIQSHEDFIEFLPTLPKEWRTGYFKGLCVKGGAVTNVEWGNGIIKKASLIASVDNLFRIKLPKVSKVECFKNDKRYDLETNNQNIATVNLNKNDVLVLEYH